MHPSLMMHYQHRMKFVFFKGGWSYWVLCMFPGISCSICSTHQVPIEAADRMLLGGCRLLDTFQLWCLTHVLSRADRCF
ncbi:hypothetical protein BKA70DRAFT_1291648 [Coprinopsis sp. MPI-PUGE-AT-0042]|nr:hypothetical protein BKA70DRAFT_1291648 [Coprinopsis sp. MPI-PUGE-AT-0042]